MTNLRRVASAIILAGVVQVALSGQERRQAPAGPPPYDTKSEITVTGTAGGTFTMPQGQQNLILTLTVDGRALQLILGPAEFIKTQKFAFKEGATIEAVGMPGFRVNSEPAMLARKLKSGSQTLTLRDEAGKPAWEK